MKARRFNDIMPAVNHVWAAEVLSMVVNTKRGPDLIAHDKTSECKFRAVQYNKLETVRWTAFDHQTRYENGLPFYWTLGLYWLEIPVKDVREKLANPDFLEQNVNWRELYLVRSDWALQFLPRLTKGKSKKSKWENTLRYFKMNDLPKVKDSYRVKKGLVHITEGVNPNRFLINGIPIRI